MNDFIQQFIATVKAYPEHVAILEDGKKAITYHALFRRALLLSHRLKNVIYPQSLVAISQPKSIDTIVSMLAVWISGSAFVLLDPGMPEERKNNILKQAKTNIVLEERGRFRYYDHRTLCPENLAYIIFTSGSSGSPKGVMVPSDGIVNFIEQQIKVFQFTPKSRSLWYLSLNFDASISDIGTALLSGATLCIETDNQLTTAAALPKLIASRGLTHIDIPPSLLAIIDPLTIPKILQTIIIGGEVCQKECVRKWSRYFRVVNVYGPTEATVCTSMKVCDERWEEPNIGKPIKNMFYQLWDSHFAQVNPGEPGELLIAGKGLSLGYVNNASLTAEKFIYYNGQRVYRTGDLAYQQPDGDYVFIGRVDRQVKVNGQLVAPEEIELKLLEMAHVEKAAIVVIEENSKRKLIAFVQTKNNTLTEQMVISFLKNHLACWMIPHQVIVQAELPITTSHKIDYQNLEMQYRLRDNASHCAPLSLDLIESKLQNIWKQVLRRQTLCSTEADFFSDLGGDSLAALEMILLAEKQGLSIPIELLPTYRTISSLASKIKLEFSTQEICAQSAAWLRANICDNLLGTFKVPQQVITQQNLHEPILLTGSTGFLGIYLLKELLNQTSRKIICLVRAKSQAEAYERIYQTAQRAQVHFNECEKSRIVPILGDITQPKLGMTDDNWQILAKSVGEIMHCGAIVNMQKNYADLKGTNADSLREVVAFSQTSKEKKIHYISTLSVFVSTDKLSGVCYEDDDLISTKSIYGGYAQSKWAAECYLWGLKRQGLPINIFRLGLITGNSQTGICSSSDFLKLFIEGLLSLGCYPEGDWSHLEMDVTPVDFAARTIVHIANQPRTNCFHIANSSRFTFTQITDVLGDQRFSLRKTTDIEWRQLFSELQSSDPKQAIVYMSLCRMMKENDFYKKYRAMDLFQSTQYIFDRKNTFEALRDSNIVCPEANAHLLKLYLGKMVA